MAKNKLSDLRDHLFAAIEDLNDPEKEPTAKSLEKAHAIGELAQVIVNSAKVEVDFLKVTGGKRGSEFLEPKLIQAKP